MNLSPSQKKSKASCRVKDYLATREELRIIDAAMASIDAGEVATDAEIKASLCQISRLYEAGLYRDEALADLDQIKTY